MNFYFYLQLCLLKGIWIFVVRLFQNRCELCIRNNINGLRINVRKFLIFNQFAVNFIQELHAHRVCIWIHMCVQVLQFVCMSNKQLLWEKLSTEIGFTWKRVCISCWQAERHDVSWIYLYLLLIHTQWIWCMIDLKMSFSCFNRYRNLFLVISSGRIAWVILNQRDSFYNNRLP